MIRLTIAFVAVAVGQLVIAAIISWLAWRRTASVLHILCVVNTVIFTSILLTIDEFKAKGLTLYSVLFALLMVWLAAVAALSGTTGFQVIRRAQVTHGPPP